MKNLALAAIILIGSLAVSASGQAKAGVQANSGSLVVGAPLVSTATRARVFGRSENVSGSSVAASQPAAKSDFIKSSAAPRRPASEWGNATINTPPETSRPRTAAKTISSPKPVVAASSLTQVYRVGVGDVLNVQLINSPTNKSTLFTVLEGGMLDYPLAGNPVPVAGLTPAEIAARLRQQIRIFDNPAVVVNVRDYASHSVTVSGLVAAPGMKVLQREAVPLYVVMSQAAPLPEAGRATVVRSGRPPIEVNLREAGSSSLLVVSGDVIRVSSQPAVSSKFFFAGGTVKAPGQKPFHSGLTLTQAILASGGLSQEAGAKVLLSRQGSDGRLVALEYNLRQIENGKIPDPVLQEGDRLQVRNQ